MRKMKVTPEIFSEVKQLLGYKVPKGAIVKMKGLSYPTIDLIGKSESHQDYVLKRSVRLEPLNAKYAGGVRTNEQILIEKVGDLTRVIGALNQQMIRIEDAITLLLEKQ